MQRNGILVNSRLTAEAVQTVAREHSFHPIRDYLNSLEWDGRDRTGAWLISLFGLPRHRLGAGRGPTVVDLGGRPDLPAGLPM